MKTFLTLLCIGVFAISISTPSATAQDTPPNADSTKKTSDYKDVSLEDLSNFSVDELSTVGIYKGSIYEDIFKSSNTASKTAEKPWEAAATLTIITAKEIEAFGATSLFQAIDRITSIYALSTPAYPQNILSIRGDNTDQYNNRVLILLNGRPVRESMFLGENRAIYTMLPLASVERIEIVRGPGSALYGTSAFTGVINIITKSGRQRKVTANVLYGSFDRLQAGVSGGATLGEVEIAGSVNYVRDGGWTMTMTDERNVKRSTRMSENGFGADVSVQAGGFSLQGFIGQTEQGAIGNTPVWGPPEYPALRDAEYRSFSQRIFLDAGYKAQFTTNYAASLNATYNGYNFKFFYPSAKDDSRRVSSSDVLVEFTNYFSFDKNLQIVAGALASFNSGQGVEPTLDRNGRVFDIFQQGSNANPFVFVPPTAQTLFSVYAQAEYRPFDALRIIAGGQVNKSPNIDVDFAPRAAVVWSITKNLGLKALYGRAFRSPSISEQLRQSTNAYGNDKLQPERIGTFEAQFYYASVENGLQIAATYYNSAGTNFIERSRPSDSLRIVNGVPVALYINASTSQYQGVELDVQGVIAGGFSLRGGASYMLQESSVQTRRFTGMPSVLVKLGVFYTNPVGINVGVFNSFVGAATDIQPVRVVNPAADAYNFLTANVQFRLKDLFKSPTFPDMQVELYGTNLLDAGVFYPEYGRRTINTIPGRAGRAFYATLRVQL
ncbi:MAG: TonB-dependent receptor plug domain-containing protein [Candidatus Kapaibacteriota bacterium]